MTQHLVAVLLVPVFLFWKLLERVFGRRAGQGPFQRVGELVPRVVCGGAGAAGQRVGHDPEKEQEGGEAEEGTDRGPLVPVGEGLRIVDVAAWHALTAQEVLGEEGQVGADEHRPEVQFACPFGVHAACHLGQVEVDACEDGKDGTEGHHVVEVCHDVVGVVIGAVDGGLAQHDAGDATDGEEEEEAVEAIAAASLAARKDYAPSAFQRVQDKLAKQISSLEKRALDEKTWLLKGEANASERPKNSVLEADLEFDHVASAPPVVSEEMTAKLEDIIKARIVEQRFDDVERVEPGLKDDKKRRQFT